MTAAVTNRQETAVAVALASDNGFMPSMSVETAVERFKVVNQFIGKIMRSGVDFGPIPGTDKPTLLKPGAEKLCTFFGFRKVPEVVEKIEDWTGKDHNGEPFFYYSYRYHLYRGETLIASADGSCNSWEKKYRWRDQAKTCPHCGKAAIIKGKAEYGGGWLCFKKKDGCNAKFKDGDQSIEGQPSGKVSNPEVCDLVNTIQKMAQKRALVAATLLAVNASEFFTQDMDDHEPEVVDVEYHRVPPVKTPPPALSVQTPEQLAESLRQLKLKTVQDAYRKAQAEGRCDKSGYAELLSQFGHTETKQLSAGQLAELAEMLDAAGRGDAYEGEVKQAS